MYTVHTSFYKWPAGDHVFLRMRSWSLRALRLFLSCFVHLLWGLSFFSCFCASIVIITGLLYRLISWCFLILNNKIGCCLLNRAVDLYSIYFLSQEEGISSLDFFSFDCEFCKKNFITSLICLFFYRVINLFRSLPKDMDQNVSVRTHEHTARETSSWILYMWFVQLHARYVCLWGCVVYCNEIIVHLFPLNSNIVETFFR